jgi:hypothetical protein
MPSRGKGVQFITLQRRRIPPMSPSPGSTGILPVSPFMLQTVA